MHKYAQIFDWLNQGEQIQFKEPFFTEWVDLSERDLFNVLRMDYSMDVFRVIPKQENQCAFKSIMQEFHKESLAVMNEDMSTSQRLKLEILSLCKDIVIKEFTRN